MRGEDLEVHEAASRFIERFGLQVESEGAPRIAGRMIGYLLLQDEPSSLDELAEGLRVSKASVSTNARALVLRGIVERRSLPGDRRDYYTIVDDPWARLLDTFRQQLQGRVELFEEAQRDLPDDLEVGKRRLRQWQAYFTHMIERLDAHLEGWCEVGAEGKSGISEEN